MPSPFPGMDPYLQRPALWPDFHLSLLDMVKEQLAPKLPDHYDIRSELNVRMVELERDLDPQDFRPDVHIGQTRAPTDRPQRPGRTATLVPKSVRVAVRQAEQRERRLKIFLNPTRTLVTVIEILSPTNKGRDAARYARKRREFLLEDVNFVEIDLLLAGKRPALNREETMPAGGYYALVAPSETRPDSSLYIWGVRDPLPTIPIPLVSPDPDVPFDLAAAVATIYDRYFYRKVLNYAEPPDVPLSPEDRKWAAAVVKKAARR